MPEQVLSRAQRNQIFDITRREGVDPADFIWSARTKRRDEPVDILRHPPTKAHFEFSYRQQGGWWLEWWPQNEDGQRHTGVGDWGYALNHVADWLRIVHRDHDAPDMWAEAAKEKTITGATASSKYQEQFSPAELKQLETGLTDIEQYITATQPLDPAGKQAVQSRFAYLRAAAKRGLQKVDWLNIFVGQVVEMITAGLLDARFYAPLMAHATTALNAVFQFGLKLLK